MLSFFLDPKREGTIESLLWVCLSVQEIDLIFSKSVALVLDLPKAKVLFVTLIVICGDNFPNFCPIDVFSLEMDPLNNEDNFVGQFTGLADI